MKVKGRFLRLVTVGNQATEQIDTEIERAAVTRVFDLRDVLELVSDGLDDRATAQQQLVVEQHQAVFHVGLELGDELHPLFKQGGEGGLRQVAFVTK